MPGSYVRVPNIRAVRLVLCLILALTVSPIAANAQDIIAIKAGRIITMAGAPIDNGVVLMRGGKIVSVGSASNLKVPAGAQIIDARSKVVMPGLVAAYTTMAGSGDAPESISSDIRAIDGFDFFADHEKLLRAGITTAYIATGDHRLVSGQGAVVKLAGSSIDSRTLTASADVRAVIGALSKDPPAIFRPAIPPTTSNPLLPAQRQLSTVRPAEFALLRQLFADARYDSDHPGSTLHTVGVGASDASLHLAERRMKLAPLKAVLQGKAPLRVAANTVGDIRSTLQFAAEQKIRITLEGAAEGGKIAWEIAKAQVHVVASSPGNVGERVSADFERDSANGVRSLDNIRQLVGAGVQVALMPSADATLVDLLSSAAVQVANGLSEDAALQLVTSGSARVLGVDSRVGSLVPGKDADLIVLSGDPLKVSTHVDVTFIDGREVYRRPEASITTARITAIKAGRIFTVSHGIIENGILLLSAGKIIGINTDGIVPDGADIIDASQSVVMPGMIDSYSYLGLHSDSLQPSLEPAAPAAGAATARMRLDAALRSGDPALTAALNSGVTAVLLAPQAAGAVSGTASLIKPIAAPDRVDTANVRVVKSVAALCFNMQGGAPRMGQPWLFEELLQGAKSYNQRRIQYVHDLQQWEHDRDEAVKQKKEAPAEPAEVTRDEDQEPFAALFRGEIPALVHANRTDEILNALKVFRDENDLSLTLMGAGEGYHVAEEIRKRNATVAIGPEIEISDHGKSVNIPSVLSDAGIHVIMETSSSSGTQFLRLNAANSVRHGMDPVEALRAITLEPAISLHVQERLGSVDVGKDADLVILSGDPLEFTSKIQKVLVNGKVVFDSHAR